MFRNQLTICSEVFPIGFALSVCECSQSVGEVEPIAATEKTAAAHFDNRFGFEGHNKVPAYKGFLT